MRKLTALATTLASLAFISQSQAAVTITGATNGAISVETAANSATPSWTTLGPITIREPNHGQRGNYAIGSGVTLVLKVPAGFQLNTSVTPDVTFTAARDIQSASVVVNDANTLTVTLTVTNNQNIDSLVIGGTTGLQVQPLSTSPLVSAHIYRPTTGGGTASINGITTSADGTTGSNFGTLTSLGSVGVSMTITTQPAPNADTGIVFTNQPVIQLTDQYGNNSTGDNTTQVTAAISSGPGSLIGTTTVTAVGGVATFTDLAATAVGTITIDFTSGSLAPVTSDAIEVVAGPPIPAALVIQTEPSSTATAGATFSQQPVVLIYDQYGAPLTNDNTTVVSASIATGNGTLQGTTNVTAVDGVVTFTDLAHNVAGDITILFSATGLSNAVSGTVTVSAAAADRLVFTTQPGGAFATKVFGTQPVVETQDQFGNFSTSGLPANLNVDLALTLGAGPLSGTTTMDIGTAAGNGVATFSDLVIGTADANNQLTATASNLLSATSDVFAVGALVPTSIVIATQPSSNAVAGVAFDQQPVLNVLDQFGDLLSSDNSTIVTVSRGTGTAALQGFPLGFAVNGVISFGGLSYNKAETIDLVFNGGPLGTVTSDSIVVGPNTATKLAFVTQPAGARVDGPFQTQPVVQAQDDYNNPSTVGLPASQALDLALTSGTGVLQGSTSIDIGTDFGNGTATFFDVAISRAGTGKQLTATSGSLASAMSVTFVNGGVDSVNVNVNSDTAVSGYTTMVGPTYYEAASGDVGVGEIILNAPAGYEFDTNAPAPTVRIQKISGPGNSGSINGGDNNEIWPVTSVSTTQIVFTVTSPSVGVSDSLTWQGVRIRALSPDTSVSGIITKTGSSVMAAVEDGVTPFAFLQTVVGGVHHLVIETQPSATANAGVEFAQQPVIRLEDQFNNLITNLNEDVTAMIATGSDVLQGTTTITSVDGYAVFTNLSYNVAETITISFSTGSVTPVVSDNVVVGPGPVTQLVFTTQPGDAVAGYAFGTQPVIKSQDQFGQDSTVGLSTNLDVTIALTSGSGTLSGTLTLDIGTDAGNGTVAFTDLSIDTAGTGNQLTASASGLSDAMSDLFVVTTADHLEYVDGDNQTGIVGSTLPTSLTVRVVDTNNAPVEGVVVRFAVQSGGGSVNPAIAVTDTNGLASTSFTLGGLLGDSNQVVTASAFVPGTPDTITFTATGTTGPAAQLVIETQPSSTAIAGEVFAQQPVVRIEDAFGNLVDTDNSTTVLAGIATGTGTLQGTTALTAVDGIVTFTNLSYTVAETITLSFQAFGLTNATSDAIVVTPAAVAQLSFTTQPGNGYTDTILDPQPVVQTQDQFGNNSTVDLAANLDVTVALTSGTGELLGTLTFDIGTAAGNGVVAYTNLQVTTGGIDKQLTASASGLTSAVSENFRVGGVDPAAIPTVPADGSSVSVEGPGYYENASGDVSVGTVILNAPVGYEFDTNATPMVRVQRIEGNGNPDLNINGAHNGANGTVYPVIETPTQLIFTVTNASSSGAVNSLIWEGVQIRAAIGVPEAESHIVKTGTSTMAAVEDGVTSWGEVVGEPRPVKIVIQTQPSATANAGIAFAQQPVVRVEDQFGNLWTNTSVNVTVAAVGSGALQGTTTVATVDGIATFSGLSYNVAETIQLNFTGFLLVGDTSTDIVVGPGTADHLIFSTQPGNGVVGQDLSVQPVVKTADQFGNPSTFGLAANVNVTLTLTSGSGALVGTTTLDIGTAAGNGTATFTGLQVNAAGTDKQLTASASGFDSAVSDNFTVAKADQTITFGALANKTVGDAPFAVNATASSGLTVNFTILSGPASVLGNTVTLSGSVGTVVVEASQPGDANYNAATSVTQSFDVVEATLPVLVSGPTNVTVIQGGSATFTVVATGGTLTYQWRQNGADIAGATNSSLTLNPALLGNAGFYDVIVSNDSGSITPGANLTVIVINGDFDLNGQAEILFENTINGRWALWYMDGTGFMSATLMRSGQALPAGWHIAGQGDFDGDGRTDVLLQSEDGRLALWTFSGINITGAAYLNGGQPVQPGWNVAAVADFTADGKADILFQHDTGIIAIWTMNGATRTGVVLVRSGQPAGEGWKAVGAADMDGDTQADLVFQNTDGRIQLWTMNGTAFDEEVLLRDGPAASTGWRIAGIADFNRDGKFDLLWQNVSGHIAVWQMNGTTFVSSTLLRDGNPAAPGWEIVGPK